MNAPMKKIRVLITCSSSLICEGMASLLQKEEDILILGKLETCILAAGILDYHADVYIYDPQLFGPDESFKIVNDIKTRAPGSRILLYLDRDIPDESLVHYLIKGIDGYIRRTDDLTKVAAAIRTIYAGNIWAERKLLDKFVRYTPLLLMSDLEAQFAKMIHPLTAREKEIISLLVIGLPNKSISYRLNISEKTVKTHLNNIFKKMNVSNRTQVVSALVYSQ
jgi:two-component system response regulator DegU